MNTSDDSKSKATRKRRRSKTEKIRDRRRIADLYLQGELQADIAETLDLSQSTISRHLQELHQEWLQASLMDLDQAKANELAKIDQLEREYRAAWKRSQEDAEMRIKKAVTSGKETRKEAQERIEGQVGNPAFLKGVEWCINKRCEILGLDAPKKTDFTSGGERITVVPLNVKVDDV